MKIKEIDRTATISWSPAESEGIYLAAGTAAQQLDASFSSNAVLELYQFDINEPGLDIPVKAAVQCENRFYKLAWGSHGIQAAEGANHANGVIVGGCDNGVMQVYDAAKILAGEQDALVLTKNKHTGPVRAIDFNSSRSNIVASGASDSEILIWDLTNPKTPMTPGPRSQPGDDVTSLAWNKQVEHILASSFSNRCVMWDLRKNEPIIKVADSTSRVKYAAVEWHPAVATQLCLASDDDVNPVIQLWDLRYATAPIRVMTAHQRGAVGLSWCKHDPEVLVSCGKDSLLKCWNPNYPHQGYELVAEIPTTSQWSFDVAFCPKNPLLIASSSFDGRVGVFGLAGGVQQPVTSSKLADSFPGMDMTLEHTPVPAQKPVAVQLREAPRWLKRPCGASFAFGGKLIKFENVKSQVQPGQQHPDPDRRIVTISQVITLPDFLERSRYLDSALSSGNLGDFCEQKASTAENPNDVNIWRYLKANFSFDPTLEYLSLLGYSPDVVAQTLQTAVKGSELNDAVEALADGMGNLMQGDEFTRIDSESDAQESPVRKIAKPFTIPTSDDFAGLLNKALLTGNVETAVKVCIENDSWSEALILASVGPVDLLKRVQQLYFKKSELTTELIKIVINQDWASLVHNCELQNWQEVLVTILTYVRNEAEFSQFAGVLGERLQLSNNESLSRNAMICFICSGDMERLAQGWSVNDSTTDVPNSLQNLVEHVTILRKAAEARGRREAVGTGQLASKLAEYAELLASQGALDLALKYLQDSNDQSIVSLRERIQYALGHQYQKPRGFQPRSRQTSESSVSSYRGGMKRPSYSAAAGPSYGSPPSTMLNGYGQPVVTPQIPAPPQPTPLQPYTPAAPKVQTILQPSKPPQPSPPINSLPLPPVSNVAHGWNDPPTLSTYSKPKQTTKTVDKVEPITHPLFGSAPPGQPSPAASAFVPGPPPSTMGGLNSQQPPSVPMFAPGGAPHAPPPSSAVNTPHGHPMASLGSTGSQHFAPPPSALTPSAAPPQASPMPPPPSGGFKHTSLNALSKRATLPNNLTPSGSAYGGSGYGGGFPASTPGGGFPGGSANVYTPGAPMGSGSAMSPMGPSYGDTSSYGYSPAPPASMIYSPGPPPPTSQPPVGMPPMSSSGFASGLPPTSVPPPFGQSPLSGPPPGGPTTASGFPPGPPPLQSSAPPLGPPPSSMAPVGPPPPSHLPATAPPPVGPPPASGYSAMPPSASASPMMNNSLGGPPAHLGSTAPPPAMFSPGPPQSNPGFLGGPPPPGSGFSQSQSSPLLPPTSGLPPQRTSPAPLSLADPFSAGPPPTSPYTPAGPPPASSFPNNPTSLPPPSMSQNGPFGGLPSNSATGLPNSSFPLSSAPPVNLVEPTPPRPTASDDFLSSFTPSGAVPPAFSPAPGVEKAVDALASSPFQTFGGSEPSRSPFSNHSSPAAPPLSASPLVVPPPPLNTSAGVSPSLTPTHPSPAPSPGQPYEPIASGGIIPAEHQDLVDVLENLRQECLKVAGLPQIKRKLEDVGRKLEILKDKLRSHTISPKTLQSLHELVDAMKSRDYPKALNLHTQVCSTGNLQEISSFFPSVKVLITSAAQLNVFL